MKRAVLLASGLAWVWAGCGPSSDPTATSAAPALPPITSGAQASSRSSSEQAIDDELSTQPLELLKVRFTSGVSDKDPVDRLDHGKPGQRVYAHLTVRNRSGRARKVKLAFSVNGKPRSEVELNVNESWSWRTWGYSTLSAADKSGTLELSITDDEGHPLADEKLPIR